MDDDEHTPRSYPLSFAFSTCPTLYVYVVLRVHLQF